MNFKEYLKENASVAADVATQPCIIGDKKKVDPEQLVKKDLKKKKKLKSFKEFIKEQNLSEDTDTYCITRGNGKDIEIWNGKTFSKLTPKWPKDGRVFDTKEEAGKIAKNSGLVDTPEDQRNTKIQKVKLFL